MTLNVAMTADGKIASVAREPGRLTSELDLQRLDLRRAEADAVMVGAETVRRIDPPLHIRHAEALELRGDRPAPLQLVISSSGNLPRGCRGLSEPEEATRVLATTPAGALRFGAPEGGIELWTLGEQFIDLGALLERLHERGVERLLCEGGGQLNGALLQAGWVDELFVTLAPSLLGGAAAPTPIDGPGLAMAERCRLTLVSVERSDDELYLHYRVSR